MGVGDVLDHAMCPGGAARRVPGAPAQRTPGPGHRLAHAGCGLPGACAAVRTRTPMSGRSRGRTPDGRGALRGPAEGGGADAGRTGRGTVDPPQG